MILADAIRLIAGGILVALGTAVLLRRGRPLSAIAFGVFALGLGALYVRPVLGIPGGGAFTHLANVVILIGFWTMFLVFPKRLARDEWRLLGVAFAAGFVGYAFEHVPLLVAAASPGDGRALAFAGLYFVSSMGILAGVILFPLRARLLGPEETSAARSLAVFSVGVGIFRGFDAGFVPATARGEAPLVALVGPALVLALPAILWVAVAARGAHARLARNTVLAHAAAVVGALVLSRFSVGTGVLGLGGALLLGFAILRGQIDGLDVKVRWGISKSTVAAVFIAVFFVVSEAAQQFFGETIGSQYAGIAAAGALVFAIAPLQRAAERLAERAVPVARPGQPEPTALRAVDTETAYRRALRLALRDRRLTREEEVYLAEVAEAMGIGAGRAAALLHEAEAEAGVAR